MNATKFIAIGRAVFADLENGERVLVAVAEFNDTGGARDVTEAASINYKEALRNAELIAAAMNWQRQASAA